MAKITDQEFEELQRIRKTGVEIASALGELNYQKISLDLQIDEQKEKIKELKGQEYLFFETLKQKYGNVTLNIDSGELN
jgi:hypothetical protein